MTERSALGSDVSASNRLTRRAFIYRAGATGLALGVGGCGSGSSLHSASAVRPAPTTSRAAATTPGPPVSRTLEEAMRGPVIKRGSSSFATASHVYNERFDNVLPAAVARPLDEQDVSGAVRWAVAHDTPLVARSGGHSYAGYSTVRDGVVLDMRLMRSIQIDRATGTAAIGTGAQLIDVYTALAAQGATLPAGSCPSVGVAGHALGGGMGLAGRKLGLASDSIRAARLVTADGSVRTVDRKSDPDLLWALQGGGGGNFGVVTELTFQIHTTPASAAWFIVSFPWSSAGDALGAWLTWAPDARDELTSILHLDAGGGSTSVSVSGQYFGAASDLGRLLTPLTTVHGAHVSSGDQDYLGLQMRWAGCLQQSLASCHTEGTRPGGTEQRARFDARSDYVAQPLSSTARSALIAAVGQRLNAPGSGAVLFDSYGGALNRVAPDATAFVHRDSRACIQYLSYDGGEAWLANTQAAMRPYVSGYAYQNYIDAGLSNWRHAYYGANYARLVSVKQRVDPHHFFRFPQAIGS